MLTLLLLAQAPSPDAVLGRFNQFMQRSDHLSATVAVKLNGRSVGTGTFKIDRPTRMRVTIKDAKGEERLILNEHGVIELEMKNQFYAPHPFLNRLYTPPLKVTQAVALVVPPIVILGTSKDLFPAQSKPSVTPNVAVNGVKADLVHVTISNQSGQQENKAFIDSAGRLIRFYSRTTNVTGTSVVEQDMSNYVVGEAFTPATFSTNVPAGFSPFALAGAGFGLEQGQPAPNIRLTSVATRRAETLKSLIGGKNTMVLITDPDFHANAELMRSIRTISRRIPNFNLVVVSSRRDVASGNRLGVQNAYYDPAGTQLAYLGVPGAPVMYLFSQKGVLAQMFFGFDGKWEGLDGAIERLKSLG